MQLGRQTHRTSELPWQLIGKSLSIVGCSRLLPLPMNKVHQVTMVTSGLRYKTIQTRKKTVATLTASATV